MYKFTNFFMSERAFFFVFWLVTVAKITSIMVVDDPDLWGHVLYGMEHLSTGSLPMVDKYSYTAYGTTWINHEWLSELLFAMFWKTFGSFGLWFLRLILVGTSLFIVLKLISENTRGVWPALLIYIISWGAMVKGFAIRPQLFTYFFFSVLLFMIHRIYLQRKWNSWCIFAVIPLMGVWANLHGGFLIGFGLLVLLIIYTSIQLSQGQMTIHDFSRTLSGTILAFLVTLINPYGVDLWKFLYRSLTISRASKITEWVPMHEVHSDWAVIAFYVIVVLMVVLFIGTRSKKDMLEWSLLLTLSVTAWMNNRHVVLFCLAAATILPRHLESLLPKIGAPRHFHRAFVLVIVLFSGLFAVGIHSFPKHRPSVMLVETSKHPYNAFKFIHDNGLYGNLAIWFDWAQSAIWYLHDTCRVAFDGRFRTVYPQVVENDYFHFHHLNDQWKNIIDHYKTQMILMPNNWPGIKQLNEHKDWQVVYQSTSADKLHKYQWEGENAVLLIRRSAFSNFISRIERGEKFVPAANRSVFQFGESFK